jgi:hypothetical protein
MRHSSIILAAVLFAVSLTHIASAQANQPNPVPPGPPPAPAAPANPSVVSDGIIYPGAELSAVAPARAQRAYARERDRQADFSLRLLLGDKQADFADSPELTAAVAEQQAAFEAFVTARENALSVLNTDTQYVAVATEHDEVKAKMQRLEQLRSRTPAQMQELAEYRLWLATRRAAPERAAIAADPTVAAAQQRLIEAGQKVARIREQFGRDIRQDPTFLAARNHAWDTQANRRATEAYYAGTMQTAREAILLSRYVADVRRSQGFIPYSVGYRFGYFGY